MTCARCLADPKPKNFVSPRRCAFDELGAFQSENWNCATLDALIKHQRHGESIYGDDETMQVVPRFAVVTAEDRSAEEGKSARCVWDGWIVLTRYKSRGRTSSAVIVGDFWPAEPLTLREAENTIAEFDRKRAAAEKKAQEQAQEKKQKDRKIFSSKHWLGRPADGAKDVERLLETGEWIADDGHPGLAFSGISPNGRNPMTWTSDCDTFSCTGASSSRYGCPSRLASDHTCKRHGCSNGARMVKTTKTKKGGA